MEISIIWPVNGEYLPADSDIAVVARVTDNGVSAPNVSVVWTIDTPLVGVIRSQGSSDAHGLVKLLVSTLIPGFQASIGIDTSIHDTATYFAVPMIGDDRARAHIIHPPKIRHIATNSAGEIVVAGVMTRGDKHSIWKPVNKVIITVQSEYKKFSADDLGIVQDMGKISPGEVVSSVYANNDNVNDEHNDPFDLFEWTYVDIPIDGSLVISAPLSGAQLSFGAAVRAAASFYDKDGVSIDGVVVDWDWQNVSVQGALSNPASSVSYRGTASTVIQAYAPTIPSLVTADLHAKVRGGRAEAWIRGVTFSGYIDITPADGEVVLMSGEWHGLNATCRRADDSLIDGGALTWSSNAPEGLVQFDPSTPTPISDGKSAVQVKADAGANLPSVNITACYVAAGS